MRLARAVRARSANDRLAPSVAGRTAEVYVCLNHIRLGVKATSKSYGWFARYLPALPDRRPGRPRTVAVNGTHRLPDALAPLINVRSGAEGDKLTPK